MRKRFLQGIIPAPVKPISDNTERKLITENQKINNKNNLN